MFSCLKCYVLVKTKKISGKILRKSGKSQGKIREFDG